MGIFGSLDADNIPDNPYWSGKGEYRATITNAFISKTDVEGTSRDHLVICYTLTEASDEENESYVGNELRDRFMFYPEMNEELLKTLPYNERRKVISANSAIKRRLCGTEDGNSVGLGQPLEEVSKEDWDPTVLVGLEVDLAVVNRGDNNQYSNVAWANVRE